MSKDPFEELFGETAGDFEPVPARERLSYEQAERVKTATLPTRQSARKAKQPRARSEADHPARPWVIVGIVAALALVGSAVIVNLVRADSTPTAAAPTATRTPAPVPTPTQPTTPTADPGEQEPSDESDAPPKVDVGTTGNMDVPLWGIKAQISGKFQWPSYEIRGDDLVLLNSSLIDQLPASCAAMREQWGITKVSDSKFEVLRPATRCDEAPELYDELWGLTAAMVDSIKPL